MADILDVDKFNSLPHPLMAVLWGCDSGITIETVCVETGCMRLDVMGQIDLSHFDNVKAVIDGDGVKHDADDFWLEDS